ncbi:MAG TPA: bifunctional 3'-5' exonuclease/DNA polymerase, partial [Diaminobutyricibacter sp.]
MHIVLARLAGERAVAVELDDHGSEVGAREIDAGALGPFVAQAEARRPRWVWNDTRAWYPALLAEGVRIDRCVDLALSHRILRLSTLSARSALALAPPTGWDAIAAIDDAPVDTAVLFDLDGDPDVAEPSPDADRDEVLAEFRLQQDALTTSSEPG